MSITYPLKRVLSSKLDGYNRPRHWEICGVPIRFTPVTGGVPASGWKHTLEEWLPRFDDVGWLDKLAKIRIIEELGDTEGVAEYQSGSATIVLQNNVSMPGVGTLIVDDSREYVLTHEMIHHAHMTLNEYDTGHGPTVPSLVNDQVSTYAGTNVYEAVAEVGAGVIHGNEFNDDVMEFYHEHDGPEAICEI